MIICEYIRLVTLIAISSEFNFSSREANLEGQFSNPL